MVSKQYSLKTDLNIGNKKKSAAAESAEEGGWSTTDV